MSTSDNKIKLFELLRDSFATKTFIKATLSRPTTECAWKRATISSFVTGNGGERVSFEYFTDRQVERKNVAYNEARDMLYSLLSTSFRSVYLKTHAEEVTFEHTDKGTFRLRRKALSVGDVSLPRHNREKNYLVSPDSPFLVELGITSASGTVRRDRYDKFRQIQKFLEVISHMIPDSALTRHSGLVAADFGSGKHYLTFALHAFFTSKSLGNRVIGIEQREELVKIGQETSAKLGLKNLDFLSGTIETTALEGIDLVVALHACDTATDDALAKAIKTNAKYICVAPCCHKYVRQRLTPSEDILPILRHGILAERFAESLTDSLRVLMLESYGYNTKLFEFISPEHTAKNTMITAVKNGNRQGSSTRRMRELCDKFGLQDFYLDTKLTKCD